MAGQQVGELMGRVWDQWGGLSPRDRKRIRRKHYALACALDDIRAEVTFELRDTYAKMVGSK